MEEKGYVEDEYEFIADQKRDGDINGDQVIEYYQEKINTVRENLDNNEIIKDFNNKLDENGNKENIPLTADDFVITKVKGQWKFEFRYRRYTQNQKRESYLII